MEYDLERLLQAGKIEEQGDWNKMLAFSKEWVEHEPFNCIAWQGIGDAYRKLARPKEAVAAYKKGLEVAPPKPVELLGRSLSSASIWYQLGHAFCELNELDKATEAFRESIRVEPRACSWNDLGVVYQAQNDNKNAFDAFKQAVALNPSDINSLKNLESMYALGGSEEGVAFVRRKLSQLSVPAPLNPQRANEDVKARVKVGFGHPAPSDEEQRAKMMIHLEKREIERKKRERDIDVDLTVEKILLAIKEGDSLPKDIDPYVNAIYSVSWGWLDAERSAFMADIEEEKAKGSPEPEAIRAALIRFTKS